MRKTNIGLQLFPLLIMVLSYVYSLEGKSFLSCVYAFIGVVFWLILFDEDKDLDNGVH